MAIDPGEFFGVAVESPPPAAQRVVLFDFDGVLIHGDAFELFIRERFARSPLRKLLALLCLPLALPLWPISRWLPVRLLVRIALLGVGTRRYARLAEAAAVWLTRRPKLFCRDGLFALRQHLAAGDRVLVVTGCERNLVEGILRELGLDGPEIVASELRAGWLGVKVGHHNVGSCKLEALGALGIRDWAVAYSDSDKDIPMLKPADEAVLVNGSAKLHGRIEKALGRPLTRVHWR